MDYRESSADLSAGTALGLFNFGYCVLGRVIEAVTGQPYAAYVQSQVLAPCGITDMKIAENKESKKAPNEVVYYGQFGEDPYKMNVTRMDCYVDGPRTVSEPRGGRPRNCGVAQTGNNQDDDDAGTRIRPKRAGEVMLRCVPEWGA